MKLKNIFSRFKSKENFQSLYEELTSLLDIARNMYSESDALKKEVINEKSSLELSSSASVEIASMVAKTADDAKNLKDASAESTNYINKSSDLINAFLDGIKNVSRDSIHLQSSVNNKLTEISKIAETLAEIKEKTKLINDIVFQTKLLSFNASVEAARAGDHGKGFSVVAQEMGNLARSSGSAAESIEKILKISIEKTTDQIKNTMVELESVTSHTIKSVEELASKSSEISTFFRQLLDLSKNTEEKAISISVATKEQKVGVEQISSAVQSLDVSANLINKLSQNTHHSAANMADKIENINKSFMDSCENLGIKLRPMIKKFDFDAALSAHIDWKMKLTKYLANPDGSLVPANICKDNACALGKWIYGDGQIYKEINVNLYESLRHSHATFHKTASQIVEYINSGHKQKAFEELSANGSYVKVSEQTIELIKSLKNLSEENVSAHQEKILNNKKAA